MDRMVLSGLSAPEVRRTDLEVLLIRLGQLYHCYPEALFRSGLVSLLDLPGLSAPEVPRTDLVPLSDPWDP